jgi:2-polyprenyl-3-methyl-5-hydroxy-6-metoxy-1,4-benzoquinol methylase
MPKRIANTKHHEEEKDILFGMINRFIGYFTRDSQRESTNNEEAEYPFVPMDTRQMIEQVKLAQATLRNRHELQRTYSFIDIGCGIGNVLLAAEQLDFEVFGIEKDPFPCKIAQKLIGEAQVRMEDIWEFTDYWKFDVIYYFRPFHDGNTQRRFELHIEDLLKPGGILIANRKMSEVINHDRRFRPLHPNLPVWEKAL